MKLYLVRDKSLQFSQQGTKEINGVVYDVKGVELSELTPNRVTDYKQAACVKLKELLEVAKDSVSTSTSSIVVIIRNVNGAWKRVRVTDNRNVLRIMMRKEDPAAAAGNLTFRVEADILKRLKKIFSDEVRVKLTLRDFASSESMVTIASPDNGVFILPAQSNVCDQNLSPLLSLETGEMEIRDSPSFVDAETFCEGSMTIPNVLWEFWIQIGNPLKGRFSVVIIVDQVPNFGNHFINKKILDNGNHHDLTIVANNGAQIKCHRAFILAHEIPAFQAMLGVDSDFREASSGTIEMDDMGEDGVRALVAYLYYGSIKEASKNCDIAFEVLYAAQKYGILYLKQKMMNVLMSNKDDFWCSTEVALQMFMLSRGMEDGSELRKGAIQIVKRNNKSLKNSEVFHNLAKNNPYAIGELVESLLA